MSKVIQIIKRIHEKHKVPYDEMVILYRVKRVSDNYYIDTILSSLKRANIPHYWISEEQILKEII